MVKPREVFELDDTTTFSYGKERYRNHVIRRAYPGEVEAYGVPRLPPGQVQWVALRRRQPGDEFCGKGFFTLPRHEKPKDDEAVAAEFYALAKGKES